MRFSLYCCLFFSLLALPLPASAAGKAEIAPEDWLPALFPSIQSALEQLKEAESQAAMNSLSRQIAELKDAQLYIAYVRLFQHLNAGERTKLLAEQTKWLKQRAQAAQDAVQSKGGSLAALEANDAELNFTEERLRDLRQRLKARTNAEE